MLFEIVHLILTNLKRGGEHVEILINEELNAYVFFLVSKLFIIFLPVSYLQIRIIFVMESDVISREITERTEIMYRLTIRIEKQSTCFIKSCHVRKKGRIFIVYRLTYNDISKKSIFNAFDLIRCILQSFINIENVAFKLINAL